MNDILKENSKYQIILFGLFNGLACNLIFFIIDFTRISNKTITFILLIIMIIFVGIFGSRIFTKKYNILFYIISLVTFFISFIIIFLLFLVLLNFVPITIEDNLGSGFLLFMILISYLFGLIISFIRS